MTEFEQATDDQPTPVTPGTMLSQARERAGITQEQVARELHITLTKVKSIESDDYLHLNTDTFIPWIPAGLCQLPEARQRTDYCRLPAACRVPGLGNRTPVPNQQRSTYKKIMGVRIVTYCVARWLMADLRLVF
jgi:hypothetical protein